MHACTCTGETLRACMHVHAFMLTLTAHACRPAHMRANIHAMCPPTSEHTHINFRCVLADWVHTTYL